MLRTVEWLGNSRVLSHSGYMHGLGKFELVREMLEMLISELPGPTASARVALCDVSVFAQCGFALSSSSAQEAQMTFCMPTTAPARVNV